MNLEDINQMISDEVSGHINVLEDNLVGIVTSETSEIRDELRLLKRQLQDIRNIVYDLVKNRNDEMFKK